MTKMVEVTQQDANNYCRVLAALGMEEEGDPVAEIAQMKIALRIKAEEHDCCAEDLIELRASANALLHQIDIGDFVDSNGHSAKMLKATHDLMRALGSRMEAKLEDAAKAHCCVSPVCGDSCCDCNGALPQEMVRKYAKRYAYLRERSLDAIKSGGVFAGMTPDNVVLNGGDLDAAIDAALDLSFNAKAHRLP